MGLIYGNSNHPVEIKKVFLDVWSLRHEIEAVIAEKYANSPDKDKPSIEEVIQEYCNTTAAGAPNLIVLDGSPADEDAEDDFSKAMADAIANPDAEDVMIGDEEENPEEAPEETSEEDPEAAAMAAEMLGDQGGEADDAEAAAAAMLGDQGGADEKSKEEGVDLNLPDFYFRRPKLDKEKMGKGTLLLADLTMMDICFFSTKNFIAGQTIVLEFLVPKKFALTAEVVFCKNYSIQSRIISQTRPPYRVHARFSFLRKGEKTLLRNFCQAIEPEIPPEQPKAKVKEEDDDDFDDLDDLGL